MDAAALQRRVEAAALRLSKGGAERRGPFRPNRLVSARAKRSRAAAAAVFRATDRLLILVGTLVGANLSASAGGLMSTAFGRILPFIAAGVVMDLMLDGLKVYGFDVRRRPAGVLRLGGVAALGAAAGIGCAALTADRGILVAVAETCAGLLLGLCASHAVWSALVARWRADGRLTPNIVIVGATAQAGALIHRALQRQDLNILGVFDDRLGRAPDAIEGVPVLGDLNALMAHRIMPAVDRIVVAVDPLARQRVRDLVQKLSVLPNSISLLVDADDAALDRLGAAALTDLSGAPLDERRAIAKRVQDLVLGTLALVVAAPVMLAIAGLVRLDSRGPAMFRQRRHGFNNEEIVVWKFRTLRHDAADATAAQQVVHNDARVTRIGRFLRRTSLDELPQLLNVLAGEMSLVGPRPHAVGMKTGEVESRELVAQYAWRHRMKPGVTGWAAIHGSRGPMHKAEEVRRRVALDVEYVDRQSFWLDLYILLMTLPCLLGDRSAVR